MALPGDSQSKTSNPDKCLHSWKEIAAYLECSVATAQRWEKSEGLPIHRHVHSSSGSAYAYVSEIENWRKQRTVAAASGNGVPKSPPIDPPEAHGRGERRLRAWWLWVAALVVVAGISIIVRSRSGARSGTGLVRLNLDVGMELPGLPRFSNVLLSPDGTRIVFSGRGPDNAFHIYTRTLDSRDSQLLQGTANAASAFFSPDGKWIGCFAGDQLIKLPAVGGPAVTLCKAPTIQARGASWGSDGNIIAALAWNSGLMRVPEEGGTPVLVTNLDKEKGEFTHRWPQVLPGAQAVLFTSSNHGNRYEDATIEVQSLKTSLRKTLIRGGFCGRYLPSGHLVYIKGTTLFAVAMDPERLELQGSPAAVMDDIRVEPDYGFMQFDFSQNGTALCMTGKLRQWPRSLAWVDSAGKVQRMPAVPQAYGDVRVSPDGKTLAVSIGTNDSQWYIALYDWQRDRLTRLTFGATDLTPQWFPDGSRLAFTSDRSDGLQNIHSVRTDGSGQPERLAASPDIQIPFSFAPRPDRLAYVELNPATGADIWTIPLGGQIKGSLRPQPFLCMTADEEAPAFSPDGRWIAYQSNEEGVSSSQVYVRSWSRPELKWQVSVGGGGRPVWSKSGDELYYETPESSIMGVRYAAKGDALVWGKPVLRFAGPIVNPENSARNYDPGPDGRLAVILAADGSRPPTGNLTVLLNFFDELRRLTGR